ncbi:anti sigma factor C-terminal domain-containing protein [Alkalibacterium putridalgicola]|uniref:anti sigma factor C-terminal domain-containing protein n=1 Tax=Alkalibacterium putridalgicola TaxID=426703 RepID=UPI0034CE2004
MNFEELLARYKDGTATEEEKAIVESELEKYASIEDYYAEQLPDEFMDSGETNKEDSTDKSFETENINKMVNRRLGKVVLVSVLIIIFLYVGIFYGLSNIVDQFYYDPTEVTQSDEEDFYQTDFSFDMDAYISLNMPGYVNSSFTIQESKGFGTYETGYFLKDLFTQNDTLHFVDVKRGRPENFYGGIFDRIPRFSIREGFDDVYSPLPEDASEQTLDVMEISKQQINNKTIKYIEELNNLSYASMTIAFDEDLTMSELYQLIEEYPELDFKWAGVRTTEPGKRWRDDQPMHLIGFVPDTNAEPSSSMEPDPEKYPLFSLDDVWLDANGAPEEFFPEAYETHFTSRLSWLKDREEFVRIFDYNADKTEFYADSLNYVEENGVETYGVLVYGTAESFSENLENLPYDKLIINEVDSSKPSVNIYFD